MSNDKVFNVINDIMTDKHPYLIGCVLSLASLGMGIGEREDGEAMELTCPSHGAVDAMLRWVPTSNGGAHIGAYCPADGRWIKWVAQTDDAAKEATANRA